MARTKKDVGDDSGFPNKYMKLISDWKDSAESMNEEELKKTIIDCQKNMSETEKDMTSDEHLNALKSEIKDVSGGYKDVLKRENSKAMYCIYLLKSRGKL